MGNISLAGATSGQITLSPPAVAGTNTLSLPAATGTVLTTAGGQNVNTSIGINGSTSGTVTLAVPAVAGTNTVTIAAQTGTLNAAGPAFYVYRSGSQTGLTTGTFTKIQLNAESFDTNNNFDSTTNYRFTPTVAGYYQLSGAASYEGSTTISRYFVTVYKNGSETSRGADIIGTGNQSVVSTLLFFNGSTDYAELYAYVGGTGLLIASGNIATYFTGCLVRGA